MKRKFLVVGCPRSGTGYMAKLLCSLGYDVGHEKFGRDGISSWAFSAKSDEVPYGDQQIDCEFEKVIHVVRRPENVIASLFYTEASLRMTHNYMSQFIEIETSASLMIQSAQMWLNWNLLIEKRFPERIQVQAESAKKLLPNMLSVQSPQECDLPQANYNSRWHLPFSWKEIVSRLTNELAVNASVYRKKIGYK